MNLNKEQLEKTLNTLKKENKVDVFVKEIIKSNKSFPNVKSISYEDLVDVYYDVFWDQIEFEFSTKGKKKKSKTLEELFEHQEENLWDIADDEVNSHFNNEVEEEAIDKLQYAIDKGHIYGAMIDEKGANVLRLVRMAEGYIIRDFLVEFQAKFQKEFTKRLK